MADSQVAIITPISGGGERPDNTLPPETQWPPVAGHPLPPYPDHGLPDGGNVGRPEHPIVIPPTPPPYPDQGLPPSVWPGVPVHPIVLPPTGPTPTPPGQPPRPDQGLPVQPGTIWPPLPPVLGNGKFLVLVWIPGLGYRWTVIDTALKPGMPLPPTATPR